jgi:hypothetical protein
VTRTFFERHADAGIQAACESLFPENDFGAPDWRTTEMVPRMHAYLEELPGKQRRLLVALFFTVEVAAALLTGTRFSRKGVDDRAELTRRWRRSRWLALKLLGDALKATTTVIYMSHPAAMAHVGGFKTCSRPNDPLALPTRPGALAEVRTE